MALGGEAMANIAKFVWREYLRAEAVSAAERQKLWESNETERSDDS